MPRPRPPHIRRERTRHGAMVWYVRVNSGPRIRLREAYGTPEFWREYQAAVTSTPAPPPPRKIVGSLSWLVDQYKASGTWAELSPRTHRKRERVYRKAIEKSGAEPGTSITRKHIKAGVE